MKNNLIKTKISTITLILILTLSAIFIALPAATAQVNLIMNLPGPEGSPHVILLGTEGVDIDLNGPSEPGIPVELWCWYPGRTVSTLIGEYVTLTVAINGDLDVYDFDFNETGDFRLYWSHPGNTSISNIEIARVLTPTWNVYIDSPSRYAINFPFNVRMEVRLGLTRQITTFTDIMLGVKAPGATDFTLQGPYSTTDGRLDISFTGAVEGATYEFQYIVPPQGSMPVNDQTTDGKYYSAVATTTIETVVYTSYPFINAVPNPVGVNQEVLLHVGITQQLQEDGMQWEDLEIRMTLPDASTETLMDINTDSTGGTSRVYVPTMIGTYTFQTYFPAQINSPERRAGAFSGETLKALGSVMLEAYSPILTLDVQEQPIPYYPGQPLPTEYWTRPIDAQLREWGAIAGSSWENEYNDAPLSPHILWVTPLSIGGVAGGSTGEHAFDCGDAYAGEWNTRFIIAGVALTVTNDVERPTQTVATDIRTGEELWRVPFTFSFGQIYYHTSMNRHAAYAYIWRDVGSTLMAYDPVSSQWVYNITNQPSGTRDFGPRGELLYYRISLNGDYMRVWNSSWAYMEGMAGMNQAWNVEHRTYDADQRGQQEEITIPAELRGSVREVIWGDRVLGTYVDDDEGISETWAFSLKPGQEGTLLYNHQANWSPPDVEPATSASRVYVEGPIEDHVHLRFQTASRKYWAYSLDTGELLWKSEDFEETKDGEHYLNHYRGNTAVAYGNLYSSGVSGIVTAYNFKTGWIWTYHATDPYSEVLWNTDWWLQYWFASDGKVYYSHEEHSVIDPKPRDSPFVCLNATTGEVIWRSNGLFRGTHWGSNGILGDSVILTMDTYDQRMYAIGKGPSTITASIKNDVIPHGSDSQITGMVTDVSPGTNDIKITMRFPNGVPAMSDGSMSDWMCYVYKQFQKPADAVGVTVTLEAIDPNMNYQNLGTTTTDSSGKYGFVFKPEVPGQYMIMATFYGSNSYFGSTTTTYLSVGPAPEPYPTVTIPPYPGYQGPSANEVAQNVLDNLPENPTSSEIAQAVEDQLDIQEPSEAPEYTTMDLVILVAVAVAIVISLVSLLLILRKR